MCVVPSVSFHFRCFDSSYLLGCPNTEKVDFCASYDAGTKYLSPHGKEGKHAGDDGDSSCDAQGFFFRKTSSVATKGHFHPQNTVSSQVSVEASRLTATVIRQWISQDVQQR